MLSSCVCMVFPSPKSRSTLRTSLGKNHATVVENETEVPLSGLSTEDFRTAPFAFQTPSVNDETELILLSERAFTLTCTLPSVRNNFLMLAVLV